MEILSEPDQSLVTAARQHAVMSTATGVSGKLSADARKHNAMRRTVLAQHPELKALSGPDARTALAIPGILAVHWTTAWLVSDAPVLVIFLVALCFGQFVMHSAGSLVHETAHKLIFRERLPKLAFDLGLESILTSFSHQLTYQHHHVTSHHTQLGNYLRDYEHEDVCGYVARRTFRHDHPVVQRCLTIATLAISLLPLGFVVAEKIPAYIVKRHSKRALYDVKRWFNSTQPSRRDRQVFIAASIASLGVQYLLLGPWGVLYHLWSVSIFEGRCGFTNHGQSLSEHYGDDRETPTHSRYWWGNPLLFNTGYHNEHHTFPNVPWSRLPKLTQAAPDMFSATMGRSYFSLWWAHIRDDFSPRRRNSHMNEDNTERCPSIGTAAPL